MHTMAAGSEPEQLRWFAQAELIHGRWAMLAAVGILVPDVLARWGFIDGGFSWFDAGSREYFADPWTLFVSQMALMGWAEGRRWADLLHPGCVDVEPDPVFSLPIGNRRLPPIFTDTATRRQPIPAVNFEKFRPNLKFSKIFEIKKEKIW